MAKQSPSILGFGLAVRALLACICLAAPALGYIQQKSQLSRLGNQYRDAELKLEAIRRTNELRSRDLDFLKTPLRLEVAAREMNLGLGPPLPGQIVRLGRSPSEIAPATGEEGKQIANNR